MHGAFKLDLLQQIKLILFPNVSNFLFSYWLPFLITRKRRQKGQNVFSFLIQQCTVYTVHASGLASFPFAVILFPHNFLLDSSPRQFEKKSDKRMSLLPEREHSRIVMLFHSSHFLFVSSRKTPNFSCASLACLA